MTTERYYLAEIAAKTVWCPRLELLESEVDKGFGHGNPEGPCSLCKGLEEILDPRFEGLRDVHHKGNHPHGWFQSCEMAKCPGYTLIRDLGVLLEIALTTIRRLSSIAFYYMEEEDDFPKGFGVILDVGGTLSDNDEELSDTPLESAAKAVWEWLEAEEKVII